MQMVISLNANRTEWSTIQGVIRGVIVITSIFNPELYNLKSSYQLIASITKCKKLTKSTVEKGSKNLGKTYLYKGIIL